jgi:hypothetical protein
MLCKVWQSVVTVQSIRSRTGSSDSLFMTAYWIVLVILLSLWLTQANFLPVYTRNRQALRSYIYIKWPNLRLSWRFLEYETFAVQEWRKFKTLWENTLVQIDIKNRLMGRNKIVRNVKELQTNHWYWYFLHELICESEKWGDSHFHSQSSTHMRNA